MEAGILFVNESRNLDADDDSDDENQELFAAGQ